MRNKKIHQGGENAASWMNIWSMEERKGTKVETSRETELVGSS